MLKMEENLKHLISRLASAGIHILDPDDRTEVFRIIQALVDMGFTEELKERIERLVRKYNN